MGFNVANKIGQGSTLKTTTLFLLCAILLSVCNGNRIADEVNIVYLQKEEIVKCFDGLSVGRRGNLVQFSVYNGNSSNEYFFREEVNNGKRVLRYLRDSIQFDISTLPEFSEISESDSNHEELKVKKILPVLHRMQDLNIVSFTSEFFVYGVFLKIYLQKYEILIISNIDEIKNPEWESYIRRCNQIDNNWFWREI